MLRALVALLLFGNLAFYTWSQGRLDPVIGVRSIGDREPERLARQVRPEAVLILPPSGLGASVGAASTCIETGPFTEAELAPAQSAAAAVLPSARWTPVRTEVPGIWIVYLGPYADSNALLRRQGELQRRRMVYEEVEAGSALAPGLSLGRFGSRAGADQALEALVKQALRGARVVEVGAPSSRYVLRADAVDGALAARLATLKPEALGNGFTACGKPASG